MFTFVDDLYQSFQTGYVADFTLHCCSIVFGPSSRIDLKANRCYAVAKTNEWGRSCKVQEPGFSPIEATRLLCYDRQPVARPALPGASAGGVAEGRLHRS